MEAKTTEKTVYKLLGLCTDIWEDYRAEVVEFESLNVEIYTRRHAVSKFPKILIAPVLLKRTAPTLLDAEALRVEINRWHTSKRNPSPEERQERLMEEKDAIAVLKKQGYRVMKRTIAYVDL